MIGNIVTACSVLLAVLFAVRLRRLTNIERRLLEFTKNRVLRRSSLAAQIHHLERVSERISQFDGWFARVATWVSAFAVVLGVLLGWHEQRENEQQRLQSQEDARLAEAANSLRRATASLEANSVGARVGSVLLLEQLASQERERYGDIVFEILAAFVRQRATVSRALSEREGGRSWPTQDIVTAVAVLGRRGIDEAVPEASMPNLSGSYLAGLSLVGAELRGLNLNRAFLVEANLTGADLSFSHFEHGHLEEAVLTRAIMDSSSFEGAYLTEARMSLGTASNAVFEGARMQGVSLMGRLLTGASFRGANLSGAVLLTSDDLAYALGDARTSLPASVVAPSRWRHPQSEG